MVASSALCSCYTEEPVQQQAVPAETVVEQSTGTVAVRESEPESSVGHEATADQGTAVVASAVAFAVASAAAFVAASVVFDAGADGRSVVGRWLLGSSAIVVAVESVSGVFEAGSVVVVVAAADSSQTAESVVTT